MRILESDLQELGAIYGIQFDSLSTLHFGENDSYFLSSGGESFVLKVYRAQRDQRVNIRDELKLLEVLRSEGLRTAEILSSATKFKIETWKDRFIILQRFCPGHMIFAATPEDFEKLGKELRALHVVPVTSLPVSRLTFESVIGRNWQHIEAAPFLNKSVIERLRTFRQELQTSFSFEPEALVHFDLHWGNVIIQDEGLLLLDWEECGIGNRILDLGAIYAHLLKRPEREAQLSALLRGYGSEFTRKELNLATMVKLFHLLGHIPTKLDMVQLKNPELIFDRYLGYFEELSL